MDEARVQESSSTEEGKTSEVSQSVEELENTSRNNSVEQALQAVHERIRVLSFSGRHPDLGKMFKCQVCGIRHRQAERDCKQVFAKRGAMELIAGQTPETETVIEARKIRAIVGAKIFKGKRLKPHLNKRQLQFVELVRKLVPDEYTQEDLNKARAKAKRILA
jgi:hypothetical protein